MADAVPAVNKNLDWRLCGIEASLAGANPYPGTNIPQRSTIFQTMALNSSAAQIFAACNSCPAGQVVQLLAGTYPSWPAAGTTITNSNFTLRGALTAGGLPATILNVGSADDGWAALDFALSHSGFPGSNAWAVSSAAVSNVATSLAVGSTSATLASVPTGLSVGQTAFFDLIADNATQGLIWDSGSEGEPNLARPSGGNLRALMQAVRITAISGSTVTFAVPIWSPWWTDARLSAQQPQLWWWGTGADGTSGSRFVTGVGIENLSIQRTNGGALNTVAFGPASNCWMKNCRLTQIGQGGVRTGYCRNIEIRDSHFELMDSVASDTYAIRIGYTSLIKIENNIGYNTPCSIGFQMVTGAAVLYNYTNIMPYGQANWLPECNMLSHGDHCDYALYEGNLSSSLWNDHIHGNSSYLTCVRNLLPGFDYNDPGRTFPKTQSIRPCNQEDFQYFFVYVGNILGTPGVQNSYQVSGGNDTTYNLGTSVSAAGISSTSTVTKLGNWNAFNNGINASESLGTSTVANSYIYTAKPPWFGNLPWPWVDTANIPANLDYRTAQVNQPAGFRFANNAVPSTPVATPALVDHLASGMDRFGVTTFTVTKPNPTLGGNCLILGIQYSTGGTIAVSDTLNGAWTAGPTTTFATRIMAIFYILNAAAGTQVITAQFTGFSAVGISKPVQCVLSEFNNIATSAAVDGSSTSQTSSTAPSFTTTTAGDLIYHWAIDFSDTGVGGGAYWATTPFAPGSGFTLLSADLQVGSCDQYLVQGAAGAISPTISRSGSAAWGCLAIAFKSAAAGAAPGTNIRIVHIQHHLLSAIIAQGRTANGIIQFPSSGNLLVLTLNTGDFPISNITDSKGNTWLHPAALLMNNTAQGQVSQIAYVPNAVTGPDLSAITITNTGTSTGDVFCVLYDIANALASPFDVASGSQGNQTVNANLVTSTITPSTTNGIVICQVAIAFNTINGVVGAGFINDTVVNAYDDAGTGAGTTTGTSTLDEDCGYAHVYNATTSPITFTFTYNHSAVGANSGVAGWAAMAAAFKGTSSGGGGFINATVIIK